MLVDDTDKLSSVLLREGRGETQDQLAKAVGITRQSLSRYETNEHTPNIELIYNIAKHYEVSADYLLGLSDVKPYTMSYKPAPGMTSKQIEKEVQRQAVRLPEELTG